MELVNTEKAPSAVEPYSQAVISQNFIFISGQLPIDPETNELIENDIVQQTNQVLKNITSILESQGLNIKDIIKNTIFIKNMNQFPTINEEYAKYFNTHKSARSAVEVSYLPKNVLIEIETIASIT